MCEYSLTDIIFAKAYARRVLSQAKWLAIIRVQHHCPPTWVSCWSCPVCFDWRLLFFTAYGCLQTSFNSELHKVAAELISLLPPSSRPYSRVGTWTRQKEERYACSREDAEAEDAQMCPCGKSIDNESQ